jgi:hypothetical protein
MVSPASPAIQNPLTPPLAPSTPPKPPTQPLPETKLDQFNSAASTAPPAEKAAVGGASKPSGAALRFGSNNSENNRPGWFRQTLGTTLSVGSGLALIPAIPLGLGQMALGIILHPLLITGAITLALPVMGLIAGKMMHK